MPSIKTHFSALGDILDATDALVRQNAKDRDALAAAVQGLSSDVIDLAQRVGALEGQGQPPDPTPGPFPERRRYDGPRVIEDQPGIVLENYFWQGDDGDGNGGVRLNNCPGARIVNCEGFGSRFSGLWLDDCPDALVSDSRFHHNGRFDAQQNRNLGHGIHWSGSSSGTVRGCELNNNFEDGVQNSRSMTGLVRIIETHIHGNLENALDGKNGSFEVEESILQAAAAKHEPIVIHRDFKSLTVRDTHLIVETSKNFLNMGVDVPVLFERCAFETRPNRDDRFFFLSHEDPKVYVGAEALPNFTRGNLKVVGCREVIAA